MKHNLATLVIGVFLAVFGGMGMFLIDWGGAQATTATLNKRIDDLDGKVEAFRYEQSIVNQEVLRSLGRLENSRR